MLLQIAAGAPAIENLAQNPKVLLRHAVVWHASVLPCTPGNDGFLSAHHRRAFCMPPLLARRASLCVLRCTPLSVNAVEREVKVLAIDADDPRGIQRGLHTALDLEAVGPGFDQLRQQLDRLHVLHVEVVALLPCGLVAETAGAGTASAITGTSAEERGHEAGTGVAVAHRAVAEDLELHAAFVVNLPDLLEAELTGYDRPRHAEALRHAGTGHAGDGLLRAGMYLEVRKHCPDPTYGAEILHDEAVDARLVIRFYVRKKLLKFVVLKEYIYRHI